MYMLALNSKITCNIIGQEFRIWAKILKKRNFRSFRTSYFLQSPNHVHEPSKNSNVRTLKHGSTKLYTTLRAHSFTSLMADLCQDI